MKDFAKTSEIALETFYYFKSYSRLNSFSIFQSYQEKTTVNFNFLTSGDIVCPKEVKHLLISLS